MKYYILKEEDGELSYDEVMLINNPEAFKIIEHDIRIKILNMLSTKAMYPAEIAKELNMHEQKVYYHIKQLMNAGVLEIEERKEIRGTTAKKLIPKNMNFALTLKPAWKDISKLIERKKEPKVKEFFAHFIKNGKLNADIVVGSPDPHGAHKARARDGHYAIDLALFLGGLCTVPKEFATKLDVDVDIKTHDKNLILVGGPVTNLLCSKINDFIPAFFDEKKNWAITSKKDVYTDDNTGIIAKIHNPYNPELSIMVIAGIRFSGTKSAVLGLTRQTNLILNRFTGQKDFVCIVQGFDLDADGKIDSVEVME